MATDKGVTVLLSASLRDLVPGYDPRTGIRVAVPPGTPVRRLCELVGIPEEKVRLVFVDGIHGSWEQELKGTERVHLFPAVGGG